MFTNERRYLGSIAFYVLGILIIFYFRNYTLTIENLIEDSITNTDNGLLILAAARHVFFGMLFAMPFIFGAYLLPKKWIVLAQVLGIMSVIFLAPSTDPLLIFSISLIGYFLLIPLHEQKFGLLAVFLVLLQLFLGFGWIDFLSWYQNLYLKLGDIPKDVKIAADFTNGISVINFVGLFLWVAFTISAIFSARLFRFYNVMLKNSERRKKEELALHEMRLRAEEARLLQEMHALVHDLKTPLMTVHGLNSLVEMSAQDEKTLQYCKKISTAVDKVNEMVSEILYDEVRKEISVEEFINYVRAHVLVKQRGQIVKFDLADNLPLLSINHIRMARAFTNLIQNAFAATTKNENGQVGVTAKPLKEDVIFQITDNGVGINKDDLAEIWELGFSTKNSSGLGLTFVKKVIENHGGTIEIESIEGKGTKVTIILPGVKSFDNSLDH